MSRCFPERQREAGTIPGVLPRGGVSSAALQSVRILFVDDDLAVRSSMQDLLKSVGVARCVALGSLSEVQAHGDEALSTDVAILDVNLGRGKPSGLDVFHWLERAGYVGRVVFLTGHAANHPLVRQATESSRSSILEKPIGFDQLMAILSEEKA